MEGAGGSRGPGRSAREQRQGAAIARQLARELRQSTTLFAQQEPRRATSGKTLPAHPLSPHVRDKTLPARVTRPHFRYKTLPARPLSPHVWYKTLPARPLSPHVRYKTLPAHPKWPNLAQSTHAGRVLYRSHHQEAKQGEFCTERKAEIELANTTALQAPPVWRTPEGPEEPESQAAVQAAGWQGHHGLAGPPPHKFRMQFDWSKFQQTQKTLQFQRCKFNV